MPVSTAAWAGSAGWASRGACRDHDPDLFFPIGAAGRGLCQIAEAKAVCAYCPVRADCLGYALATGQDAGVWGGATEDERRQIRSARPRRDARRAIVAQPWRVWAPPWRIVTSPGQTVPVISWSGRQGIEPA